MKNGHDQYIPIEQRGWTLAADAGLYCLPWLKELSTIDPDQGKKDRPSRTSSSNSKIIPRGLLERADEPEWGFEYVDSMQPARELHTLDPDHPLWVVQAPMGTVDSLREYNDTFDITGQDIYPISYPPGKHSHLPNRAISLVGDHTRLMQDVVYRDKPIWMTLQIAWSGVAKPGATLVMPTLFQERFMAYEAIINGARGLIWFGGNLTPPLPPPTKSSAGTGRGST